MKVLHNCDEKYAAGDVTYRRCCNPEHLYLGTIADNQRDMVERGRSARGTRNRHNSLTEDQVREIRRLFATGKYAQQGIADHFGVSQITVSRIVRRINWGWLSDTDD